MLELFMPYSDRIKRLHIGTRIARSQLKAHLKKERNLPRVGKMFRLLNAPTKQKK